MIRKTNTVIEPPPKAERWIEKHSNSVYCCLWPKSGSSAMISSPSYAGLTWGQHSLWETSAIFGTVVYPTEELNSMKKKVDAEQILMHQEVFRNHLKSLREFSCSFPGLRNLLTYRNPTMQFQEELRIRLTPCKEPGDTDNEDRVFPDLEIRVNIDAITKETQVSSARLIVEVREVDLLLPGERIDIRFRNECYIPYSYQIDPSITAFVKASKFELSGESRLKTPSNLTLLVASHSIWKASLLDEPPIFETGPDVLVGYTFASLEHRSYCTEPAPHWNIEYTVIEAGMTGGRRDEIRVILDEKSEIGLDVESFRRRVKRMEHFIHDVRSRDFQSHAKFRRPETLLDREDGK